MLSPRSIERKAMVFSPEPKLIELLTDDRMKTIPIMYPIIPKRQHQAYRARGSDLSSRDPNVPNMEGCVNIQSSRDQEKLNEEDEFKDAVDRVAAEPRIDPNAAKKSAYGRQPYFCPYARERLAKQKYEKKSGAASGEASGKAKDTAAAGDNKIDTVNTEESKTDLRTAE